MACLVIDEADRCLEIGFEEEMKKILKLLPTERQTMLFSATQTADIRSLAKLSFQSTPIYIGVDDAQTHKTNERLEQGYVVVPAEKRFLLLFTFLKKNRKKKVRTLPQHLANPLLIQGAGPILNDSAQAQVVPMHIVRLCAECANPSPGTILMREEVRRR